MTQLAESLKGAKRDNRSLLTFVRYADDFVVLHPNPEVIDKAKAILSDWLKEVGLEISASKTRITHTSVGFEFLGMNIRQYKVGKYNAETPIIRHIKVKGGKSPFDGELTYWASRLGKHPELRTGVSKLLKAQKGKCSHCGLTFKDGDIWDIDHIIPRSLGGKDIYSNLQLLHRHCHDNKTASDGSFSECSHEKGQVIEERSEAKVSRSVLMTSGFREEVA